MTFKCERCGACCKGFSVTVVPDIDSELLKVHGIKPGKSFQLHVTHNCEHLRVLKGTDIHFCAIYENRPEICRKFSCNGRKSIIESI